MDDLKLIKKHYGEKMMHLCRELFPTILEKKGLLFSLLEQNFAFSKFLVEDIIESEQRENFRDFILELVEPKEKEKIKTDKTVKELLEEAGYILYECKTESDIQSFKKYYKKGEELCTFNGGRLDSCYVFFAVKKDVDKIKRNNLKPERQDDYGTSVISIQFSRGKNNVLSIKNRYNHTVDDCDSTFSNNLENIIPGLTYSFEKEYGLNISLSFLDELRLPNYIATEDGKIYKYNYEINHVCYCPNNVIIDNFEVKQFEKEKYLVIDYFIIDLVNKEIKTYDSSIKDSFIDELINIEKIEINNINEGKEIKIIYDSGKEAIINVDKYNRISSYKNKNLKKIGDNFLYKNISLNEIDIQNVEEIGDYFLFRNMSLNMIIIDNVKKIGNSFLENNCFLKNISLEKVMEIGDNFLLDNWHLEEIDLLNVIKIGNCFLQSNDSVKKIILSKVREIGDDFLGFNNSLEMIEMPNVVLIGNNFLSSNRCLQSFILSNKVLVGKNFLFSITNFNLLKLRTLIILRSILINPIYNFVDRSNKNGKRK